jgi:hypothetical protein
VAQQEAHEMFVEKTSMPFLGSSYTPPWSVRTPRRTPRWLLGPAH